MSENAESDYDVLAALDLDHKQFADRGDTSLFGDAAAEIRRLHAEVEHWKAHAQEAGEGFSRVCLDAARRSARNREATGLLNDLLTAKALRLDAEEWQLVWDRVFRFLNPPASTDGGA